MVGINVLINAIIVITLSNGITNVINKGKNLPSANARIFYIFILLKLSKFQTLKTFNIIHCFLQICFVHDLCIKWLLFHAAIWTWIDTNYLFKFRFSFIHFILPDIQNVFDKNCFKIPYLLNSSVNKLTLLYYFNECFNSQLYINFRYHYFCIIHLMAY